MAGLLKWVEAKLEHFDAVAEEAVTAATSEINTEEQLKQLIGRLRNDIKTLQSMFRQRMNELKDKFQAQLDSEQDKTRSLELSLKQMQAESQILKDTIRGLQSQVTHLETLKEQLANCMDTYSPKTETSSGEEYEHSRLAQQLAVYREFITVEKRKAEDAVREKNQLEELLETTKERQMEVVEELKQQLEHAHTRERQLEKLLDDERSEQMSKADDKNMLALSENLQTKQRTIENLLSEKATLTYQLEAEKQEKVALMTQSPQSRTGFQSATALAGASRSIRNFLSWTDTGFKEIVYFLEETPLARLFYMLYVILIHLFIFYWIVAPETQPFLNPN